MIRDSRTYGLSPASISLNPNAPKIYYTHFEILRPISMLSVPYWTDDDGGFIAPNYHFCPNYELDSFFQLTHVGWVDPNFDDFPNLSDLTFFLDCFRVHFSPIHATHDVVDTLILLEWFF